MVVRSQIKQGAGLKNIRPAMPSSSTGPDERLKLLPVTIIGIAQSGIDQAFLRQFSWFAAGGHDTGGGIRAGDDTLLLRDGRSGRDDRSL